MCQNAYFSLLCIKQSINRDGGSTNILPSKYDFSNVKTTGNNLYKLLFLGVSFCQAPEGHFKAIWRVQISKMFPSAPTMWRLGQILYGCSPTDFMLAPALPHQNFFQKRHCLSFLGKKGKFGPRILIKIAFIGFCTLCPHCVTA